MLALVMRYCKWPCPVWNEEFRNLSVGDRRKLILEGKCILENSHEVVFFNIPVRIGEREGFSLCS